MPEIAEIPSSPPPLAHIHHLDISILPQHSNSPINRATHSRQGEVARCGSEQSLPSLAASSDKGPPTISVPTGKAEEASTGTRAVDPLFPTPSDTHRFDDCAVTLKGNKSGMGAARRPAQEAVRRERHPHRRHEVYTPQGGMDFFGVALPHRPLTSTSSSVHLLLIVLLLCTAGACLAAPALADPLESPLPFYTYPEHLSPPILEPAKTPTQPTAFATQASWYPSPAATDALLTVISTHLLAPPAATPTSARSTEEGKGSQGLSALAIVGIIAASTLASMGICGIFSLSRNRYPPQHPYHQGQGQPQGAPAPYYALSPVHHKKTPLPYEYSIYGAPPAQQLPAYHPPAQYSYYPTNQHPNQYPAYYAAPAAQAAMPQTVAIQPSGSYYAPAQQHQPVAEPEPAAGKEVRFGSVAVRRYEKEN